jgi:tRNA pseudouridine38-40 synthase
MVEAAQLLVGFHDFAAFCRAKPQGTSLRHLHELSVQRDDDSMIVFTIIADAFCHSMVRSLVGALTQIGRGRRDTAWLADLLSHTVRAGDVAVMPACGLTLEEVVYPPDHELAARAHQTRSRRDGRP